MHYVYFRKKTNLVVNRESNDSFRHERGTKKKGPLKGIEPKTSDFAVMRYSSIELHKKPYGELAHNKAHL